MNSAGSSRRLPVVFLLGILVLGYALLAKWEKWPGGTMLLILSGTLVWCGALLPNRNVVQGSGRLARMAIALVVSYAVFRLLYWPGAPLLGVLAFALLAWAGARWWKSDRAHKPVAIMLGVGTAATIALMSIPVHALYHYMFFETPGAQRFMHAGIGHWYRYSWFLYEDGQYARSGAMIDSAMAEVRDHAARTGRKGDRLLKQLEQAHERIEAREWHAFEPLHVPARTGP